MPIYDLFYLNTIPIGIYLYTDFLNIFPFTQDANVNKLFKLIAAIRKQPNLQSYALNRSASSGEEDEDEDGEGEEEEDTLTESEFEGCGGTNGDNGDDERDHKGSKTNARKSHTAPKPNPAVEKSEKGVPISGTCKVGGSSSTGRAPEQVRYDQIMADIADLQAKMILWISLENSFWSLSFVPHPALHDVRYYHITKPFQLYICPSIDLAQEYGSYWLLGVCLYSQTRKRYIDIYI